MKNSDPNPLMFFFPRFLLGAGVNFLGVIAIEAIHFIVGMGAFTHNVSDELRMINFLRWLWSPISKLIYLRADLILPTVPFICISVITMGLAFGFLGYFMLQLKKTLVNKPNNTQ